MVLLMLGNSHICALQRVAIQDLGLEFGVFSVEVGLGLWGLGV